MALTLRAGVAEAIRAHGVETYPNECCGALYRPRRRRHRDVRAAEHHRGRAAPAVSRASAGLPRSREAGHASWGPSCSGSITRIRIIPRGRRSTISITRGRSSRTSSCPSAPGTPEDMTSWRLREDRSAFDQEDLTYAEHDSHSDAASPVHRQEGIRRGQRRHRRRAARRPDDALRRAAQAPLCRRRASCGTSSTSI